MDEHQIQGRTPRPISFPPARPLPVVLLADISHSMSTAGKIDVLNAAVGEMLAAFAREDTARAEIHAAIITFGGEAVLHTTLSPSRQVQWTPMQADGGTPLGAALEIATGLLEDRERVPSRAYRPALVLASDGIPTDEWRGPLQRLLDSERGRKAQRFALAIGADADHEVLRAYLGGGSEGLFAAHQAREIRTFFRWVTLSVTSRSRSAQPNQAVEIDPYRVEDYGDF